MTERDWLIIMGLVTRDIADGLMRVQRPFGMSMERWDKSDHKRDEMGRAVYEGLLKWKDNLQKVITHDQS